MKVMQQAAALVVAVIAGSALVSAVLGLVMAFIAYGRLVLHRIT